MRHDKSKFFRTFGTSDRDFVTLGIAVAAIILFVGTGGKVLPQIVRAWQGIGEGPDTLLVNAVLLNIALILLGWRRYKELTQEIDQTREAEQEARLLAEIDPLTGCLNRRSLTSAVDIMIDQCEQNGQALALIMIDLDNFKQVNDLNGHKSGDQVLQQAATRIRSLLPRGGLLARLGGDEFTCVFPFDARAPERVEQIANRLIEKVSKPIEIGGQIAEVTISLGISASERSGQPAGGDVDAKALMHKADIAMYHAKKQGKNRFFWFESSMESELRFRNEMIQGLRRGIEKGEFVPFYEQQIDLETGKLVGFEMLARWNSPDFGIVGPDIFIPIAEEMGLIGDLSEQLIVQAFTDAKSWAPELTLSVNISPVQMRDPWFSQKLLKLLIEHNFPPHRLEIEITESCLHENIGMVRTMIASLQNQGVHVSLDDFGTGYASLSQLSSLPFDRLKIDRSFVKELSGSNSGAKIVQAMVSMSDGLHMPVTAEGIEDEKILEALKTLGKMKGQGYHYGLPENGEAVRKRLAESGQLAQEVPARTGTAEDPAPESRTA
ncbi:putative bifunctional diguanylate cyclase/phosphodiesterase [Qipengyuania oceanensis]|uniref:EAL domain-containing protein n=1 Tax=Qipengyuania oceanensis TaxID=1463597 RepID=A0A844YJK8_9SPHN|nr:EAL domain-containing protein [Qipengyuania oceanensis]MXO63675.1 EAL domain-containing protein [Qipengyuania oceanensis]